MLLAYAVFPDVVTPVTTDPAIPRHSAWTIIAASHFLRSKQGINLPALVTSLEAFPDFQALVVYLLTGP